MTHLRHGRTVVRLNPTALTKKVLAYRNVKKNFRVICKQC